MHRERAAPDPRRLGRGRGRKVGAPAERYALHRVFVQRDGWQVKGLELGGGSRARAYQCGLDEKLPGRVRDLFEERMGGRGPDLHELAVRIWSPAVYSKNGFYSKTAKRKRGLSATSR